MLITEIILENFMSYEYARIPLRPGLNIICGPNGAGKSSILLAISIALGQAYTERSRKLSDLIRWGHDAARVTLVFDNTAVQGKRPIPRISTDFFRISRFLEKDGTYWFQVNFQTVSKREVTTILNEFGINSDNMLIIMHQRMMEEFGITTSKQRLDMVEEAVGLGKYRQNILESQEKLTQVLSEEVSISTLFENAEQTLSYWKQEYEKFQEKQELLEQKERLQREHVEAQIVRQQNHVAAWQKKVALVEVEYEKLVHTLNDVHEKVATASTQLTKLRYEHQQVFYSLIDVEKTKASWGSSFRILQSTHDTLLNVQDKNTELQVLDLFITYINQLDTQINISKQNFKHSDVTINDLLSQMKQFDEAIHQNIETYIDERVQAAVLQFQQDTKQAELKSTSDELRKAISDLETLQSLLGDSPSRITEGRSPLEVADELKIVNIKLASMGDLSADVEQMYRNYLDLFNDLRSRILEVSENREKALRDVGERQRIWRRKIRDLLKEVNTVYIQFLTNINAIGNVRLVHADDIDAAGLELTVGFKGAEPSMLDAYTQSGGERSTATMAFLLALQQYVKSPFRAVDEFDIHMDPRNREIISEMLYKQLQGNKQIQYLTITPSQISGIQGDVHVVTVQNLEGSSEIKVVP
jgi:chromosome segregation ATPase